MNVLRSVLGPYALTIPFKSVTLPERALPDDLATLPGKRFVFASEAIENARLNEARLKALTGSDSIAARHLFARWFTFEPHLKLWLSCNHLPAVQDTSEGFRRRVHVIPFRRSFPVRQRDRALESKLRAEGVGILRWAVEGCRRWQRCGLKPPQVVLDATTEYSQTFDPVSRFVAEACDRDPRLSCGATEVYQAFVEWAAEQGGPACSQREFGGKLGRRFNRTRTGEGVRYRGVGLRPYAAVRR